MICQELAFDPVLCLKTAVHNIKTLEVGRSVGHEKLGAVENVESMFAV